MLKKRAPIARTLAAVLAICFTATAWADIPEISGTPNPTAFFKRFDLIKDKEGHVDQIWVHTAKKRHGIAEEEEDFSIAPVLDQVHNELTFAATQGLLNEQAFVEGFSADELAGWPKRYKRYAKQSLEALKDVDFDAMYADADFQETMGKIGKKFKDHLRGHHVVAHLTDPRFFYSRAVGRAIYKQAVKLVKRKLGNKPYLHIAEAIVGRISLMVEQRRAYHQNMLLHYLENFKPAELGLTADEVKEARSSIYESQIPWFAFWISKQATKNWLYFGEARFGAFRDMGDMTLYNAKSHYSVIGDRIDYAFQVVTEKNKKKIVNLMDKRFMLSKMPSTAYYFDKPNKVAHQRLLLQLVQMGIGYIPVPKVPFVKSIFQSFIGSMYENQVLTEGALYGFFESTGFRTGLNELRNQSLNPYLVEDLRSE